MPTATLPAASTGHLPLVTCVLAVGVFLMGTTGYVVAGVLPEIVGDVGISVTYVARVIIMFAVGMIVDTPTMAILTLRLACQRASGLALVVFAIGHASSQSVRVSRSSSAPGC